MTRSRLLVSTIAFAAGVAGLIVLAGTRDLESYDHAFISLPRGTAMHTVHVLGQPVYTLSLGFGVRLPLQGSFGASPAAAFARFAPAPVTYWLMLAFAIASALLVVRHALEDECGRMVTWLTAILLFCSVALVTSTILNDWPDVAFTYCAFVASAFAPHAMLRIMGRPGSSVARIAGMVSVGAVVGAAVAVAHAGYWPHIALTLVSAGILVLLRSEYGWRARVVALAVLALFAGAATAAQVPDILRELNIPGADMSALGRYTEPPEGTLIGANLFPFGEFGSRLPFSHLILAVIALGIGCALTDRSARRMSIGGAALSILLAVAATVPGGSTPYSPTSVWALRDPAAAFALFAGATAAAALLRRRARIPTAPALAALLLAALQGPAYAAALVFNEPADQIARLTSMPGADEGVWTRDATPPGERVYRRGIPRAVRPSGDRIALWPGVRSRMRTDRAATADFADAGFSIVTTWTKQRTVRGLVRPNELVFNQSTDLSPGVLCDADWIEFLQLRYLLAPMGTEVCSVWTPIRGAVVDARHELYVSAVRDDSLRGLPLPQGSSVPAFAPALSPESDVIRRLEPLGGTSVAIDTVDVVVRLEARSDAARYLLVLPVAWDPGWQSSNGAIENVGGLLAVRDVTEAVVNLQFVPDGVAWLRAVAMTLAQIAALAGVAGLVYFAPK